jgi:hypothetical protein
MKPEKPPDFDWVTARSKCSIVSMFEELRTLAKQNVEARNANPTGDDGPGRFEFSDIDGERAFKIFDRRSSERRAVEFWADRESILIAISPDVENRATLALDDQGECKFKLGAKQLDPWQLMRHALEDLFFGPTEIERAIAAKRDAAQDRQPI